VPRRIRVPTWEKLAIVARAAFQKTRDSILNT
jgi:hypothetical protein